MDGWSVVWLPETTGGPRDIRNDWSVTHENPIEKEYSLHLNSLSDRNSIATDRRVIDMTADFTLRFLFRTPDPDSRGPTVRCLDMEENKLNQDAGYTIDDMDSFFFDDGISLGFQGAISKDGSPYNGELTFCGETGSFESYPPETVHSVHISKEGDTATLYLNEEQRLSGSVTPEGQYRLLLASSGTWGSESSMYFDEVVFAPGEAGLPDSDPPGDSGSDDDNDDGVTAAFSVVSSNPEVDRPLQLDASDSSASGSEIASYEWDVGADGSVDVTGKRRTYSIGSIGEVPIELTVTDGTGRTDSTRETVTVDLTRVSVLREVAAEIDELSVTDMGHADEVDRRVTALDRATKDGQIPLVVGKEATERLIQGERVAESVLRGLGTAPYDRASRDYDLAIHTTEVVLDLLVDLLLLAGTAASRAFTSFVGSHSSVLGSHVHSLVSSLDDAVARILDFVAAHSTAAREAITDGAHLIADAVLEELSARAAVSDIEARIDEQKGAVAPTLRSGLEQSPSSGATVDTDLDDGFAALYGGLNADAISADGLDGSLEGAMTAVGDGVEDINAHLSFAHARLSEIQQTLGNFDIVENLLEFWEAAQEEDWSQVGLSFLWTISSLVGSVVGAVFNAIGYSIGASTMRALTHANYVTQQGLVSGESRM